MKTKEGLWKLSPSALYAYTECKVCFWLNNHFKKAPMLPLLLNTAMDDILKARYDKYRADGSFPPEVKELENEGLRPFADLVQLNEWREKYTSLRVVNEDVGYQLQGKIDELLVDRDGKFVPADYKSSGNPPKDDKQKYYRDQLAAYGFMFKKHGFDVSDRAYLLHYYVKDHDDPAIEVKFNGEVDLVQINLDALEEKLGDMVALLNGPYPEDSSDCDNCAYRKGSSELATK